MRRDPKQSAAVPMPPSDDAWERIVGAYRLAGTPDNAVERGGFLARMADDDAPITVIEIARPRDDARDEHDRYLAAIASATNQAGGEVVAIADILAPGTGDLSSYTDFAGGVANLLAFPSRRAYLAALLSDAWQGALDARRASVAEAIVLIAGENTIPPAAKTMLGEPRMAADFPTPRVDGKSPGQLIDEILSIYPDGGADPTRAQLEVMMGYPGFREQPVHYINLYAFGDGSDPNAKGAAEHDAYNAAALQSVGAHGGHPLLRATVEHRIAGEIAWDRVVFVRWPSLAVFTDMRLEPGYIEAQRHRVASAEIYGNFVTVKRGD